MSAQKGNDLEAFFEPRGVAIFGSFRDWTGLGWGAMTNLLQFKFGGGIHPVNPNYSEVLGFKVYPNIDEVPEAVDLAIVMTPPGTVPGIIEQCAGRGVKAAVIVSENFAEAGEAGARLQRQLVEVVNRTGIRIMGPNTVGALNTSTGLVTIPYPIGYGSIRKGGIAYCSQTGVTMAQCQPLQDRAYPVSKMCDVGNKCDVDEVDVLNYLADDPETQVLAMHVEGVRDGRRFLAAARDFAARKPLIVFKSARSEAGARASASHTGSLAVDDEVYDSAIRQAGAIRVGSWQEYWDVPKVFASQPLPRGNRVAVISHSGGVGVVAADAARDAGLQVAGLTAVTLKRLAALSPRLCGNPVDLGPGLSVAEDPFSAQEEAIAAVLGDDNIDCAVIIIYVGVMSPIQPLVETFTRLKQRFPLPLTIWIYGTKLSQIEEVRRELEALGIPTYVDVETAVKALGAAASYARCRDGLDDTQA